MNAARQAALPLINRTKTAAEKYAESIRQLNSARRMGAITEKEHQRAIASVRAEMHQAQQAKKLSTRMTQGLSNAFSFLSPQILAASAAMAAFYGATRLLQRSINLAAELEEVNVRFGVLTGSAKDADELVKSMRTLANTTALTFSGLQKNAQTMLAFGVVTERVIPTLKQIGDITSGNDERMQSLSLAFAQMTSAGKLMGQDLLQMVNAGFNPLQEISKQTGVSITELRKQMEAGAISSELVAMAFESATSSGGQFNNMLEASKQTFAGQMRQLNSDIEVLTTAIGEELLPTVKELVSTFSGIGSEENIALIREMTFLATAAGKFGMDPVKSVRSVLERFGIVEKQVEGVAASAAGFGERISEAEDKMSAMLANAKSDAFREMTKEFEDQIALLELGEKGFARREMYAKGFTAEQILQIEAQKEYIEQQQALIDKEKEAERERKKARDEQQRAVEDLMKRGQEMMDNNNPIRAVAKQLADLDVLLNANAIDQATYFKERNKILKEQVAKEGKSQSAAAIEVGSSAAIDFRNQQINAAVDQQYEESKKQTLLQQSQLDALNLANQRLQELGIMRRITP